uniref:Rab-GAP TBC domain-containing protein n=1 Tax=Rhizochromulina marina TaxID=1034831 RepID=A0A7S2S3E1_9STRA
MDGFLTDLEAQAREVLAGSSAAVQASCLALYLESGELVTVVQAGGAPGAPHCKSGGPGPGVTQLVMNVSGTLHCAHQIRGLGLGGLRQALVYQDTSIDIHLVQAPFILTATVRREANVGALRGELQRLMNSVVALLQTRPTPHPSSPLSSLPAMRETPRALARDLMSGKPLHWRHRRVAWQILARDLVKRTRWCPDHDPGVLGRTPSESVADKIRRDVPRTMVREPLFRAEDSPGRRMLFDLLCAFAVSHSAVGYCQGLNYVAAMLLIVTQADSCGADVALEIFAAAVCHVQSVFIAGVPGFKRAIQILEDLVALHLPGLSRHFDEAGLSLQMVASPWVHCLFTHPTVPLQLSMHIFELYLVLGCEAIVRMALALLEYHAGELMRLEQLDMIAALQQATVRMEAIHFEPVVARCLKYHIPRSYQDELSELGGIQSSEEQPRPQRDQEEQQGS